MLSDTLRATTRLKEDMKDVMESNVQTSECGMTAITQTSSHKQEINGSGLKSAAPFLLHLGRFAGLWLVYW